MTKIKKIAIVTTHSFGYIDFLVALLNDSDKVDLTYINIDAIPFSYKNKISRIKNFFLKLCSLPSLKEKNRTNFIKNSLPKGESFDQTLIIRPDKLEKEALSFLRKHSIEKTCFLFDGIENFKRQKELLSFFDTVYSYDKVDAEQHNFKFLTNYIYDTQIESRPITNYAFNISSFDMRFPFIEKLAKNLFLNKIPYLFIVKKSKIAKHEYVEITDEYLSIEDVKEHIADSLALVDIQFENQHGLSFRVFEALGYSKKLITNNQDIVNYDFYNANNIFVISESNCEIPHSFFETDYVEIDSEIIDKYLLKNWIFEVFKIKIC